MASTSFDRMAPLLPPGGQVASAGGSAAASAPPHQVDSADDSSCCSVEQLHDAARAVDTLLGMIGLIILALILGMRLLA